MMTTFIVVVASMASIAAAVVAIPLLRSKHSRMLGGLAAALVIGAPAGLYPLFSNLDWHTPVNAKVAASPDVLAMVAKLEQHLKAQPDDMTGWLMMGRSYMALERPDDAVIAYQHAHALAKGADSAKIADAALGLGEALSVRAGGEISAQASQFFEEALTQTPDDPKALFYGGFAAALRGDSRVARKRWQTLKGLHPPAQIEQMLEVRLAELGSESGGGPAGSIATGNRQSRTNASTAPSSDAQVDVNLSIATALEARVTGGAPLFVFAREPGASGPPLAAKRLTTAAIGTRVSLSAADLMVPGRVIRSGQKVSITARVSFSGQPTSAAGDLYGEADYVVGSGGTVDLVMDQVAQ